MSMNAASHKANAARRDKSVMTEGGTVERSESRSQTKSVMTEGGTAERSESRSQTKSVMTEGGLAERSESRSRLRSFVLISHESRPEPTRRYPPAPVLECQNIGVGANQIRGNEQMRAGRMMGATIAAIDRHFSLCRYGSTVGIG